jgi:hypothetical protein
MKRSFVAVALLITGLLTGPVVGLAYDGSSAPPAWPNRGYIFPSSRYAQDHRPIYQHRHPRAFVPRRVWVGPTWAWNGWRWGRVPGYWTR